MFMQDTEAICIPKCDFAMFFCILLHNKTVCIFETCLLSLCIVFCARFARKNVNISAIYIVYRLMILYLDQL